MDTVEFGPTWDNPSPDWTDKNTYDLRLSACEKCPAYYAQYIGGEKRFTEKNICGVCHCNMWGKARFSHEKCPAGNW